MNSKDGKNISLNGLIKFFQVKAVYAKPKICSRESSPPKEEGSSSVRGNRTRDTQRVNRGRGNEPADGVRADDQVATARNDVQASGARCSEHVERARVNVHRSRTKEINENVHRTKVNADKGRNAAKVKSRDEEVKGSKHIASANFANSAGGGDVSFPRKERSQSKKSDNDNVPDRGKTGAGVTGSRKGQKEENIVKLSQNDTLIEKSSKPGLLRHIHNAARYRIPQCFEGAFVSVKKGSTNNNWVIGHSMSFSSVSPGGYKVLLSYAERNKSDAVPYFVLEAAPGGQMSTELRVSPTQKTRASVIAQIADKQLYSFESIFDVYSENSTASVLAVNKEFIAFHYLKSITERLSLGAELVARGVALSSASVAARWCHEDISLSATVGDRGLDVCYAKNIRPYLTVASMLEIGFGIQRAVATLAYEWHTRDWTVRASADSDGLVGATLHRALGGTRARLACTISALLNHPNDKFKLGFGITAAID